MVAEVDRFHHGNKVVGMTQSPETEGFTVPEDPQERSLWMQEMTGLMLMTRVRQSVINDLPDDLSAVARAAACKAVDDTLLLPHDVG